MAMTSSIAIAPWREPRRFPLQGHRRRQSGASAAEVSQIFLAAGSRSYRSVRRAYWSCRSGLASRFLSTALDVPVVPSEIDPAAIQSFAQAKVRSVGSAKFLDVPDQIGTRWWRAGPGQSLLVRDCYPAMLKMILEQGNLKYRRATEYTTGSVVLGNPGIGKTGFLWWCLWNLLQQGEAIIIKLPKKKYVCISEYHDGKPVVSEHKSYPAAIFPPGARPWYLADRSIDEGDWGRSCKFLLTCSPLKANFHEFSKGRGVRLLYDPVWTLQELLALNDQEFKQSPEDVERRFGMWGGIPRYVLVQVDPASQKALDAAAQNADKIMQLEGLPQGESHRVFHMKVSEDHSSYSLALASPYVADKVCSNLPMARLKRFVSTVQGPNVRDIQGKLFETFVLRNVLPRGVKLLSRALQGDGSFGPVQEVSLPGLGVLHTLKAAGVAHDVAFPTLPLETGDGNSVFQPMPSTHREWDFLAHGSVFQVTVSERRALKIGKATEEAVGFLRSFEGWQERKINFNILVPEFILSSFSIDWFETVPTGRKRSSKDIALLIEEVKRRLVTLNVGVNVCTMRLGGGTCPVCMGTGFTSTDTEVFEAVQESLASSS